MRSPVRVLRRRWNFALNFLEVGEMLNSGDSLNDRVQWALDRHPNIPKRALRFETSEGRVTLRGKVGSWYQKQMAQEALRRLDGVHAIDNQLEVSWHHDVPRKSSIA